MRLLLRFDWPQFRGPADVRHFTGFIARIASVNAIGPEQRNRVAIEQHSRLGEIPLLSSPVRSCQRLPSVMRAD
jgi:hypothetical protein